MDNTPDVGRPAPDGGLLKRVVVDHVAGQFHRPRGPLGWLAGQIMNKRGSNVDRNRWLAELLELRRNHRVLEIGPGPGVALEEVGRLVTTGHLTGLDHSATMLKQSGRRNRQLVDDGRLTLIEGRAEQPPTDLGPFERIYAMNVWHFWDDQEAVMAGLVQRLSAGGRLALGYQPRHPGADVSDMHAGRRCLIDQMTRLGLVGIEDHVADLEPPVTVVIGARAGMGDM